VPCRRSIFFTSSPLDNRQERRPTPVECQGVERVLGRGPGLDSRHGTATRCSALSGLSSARCAERSISTRTETVPLQGFRSAELVPRVYPRGVFRFRSLEEAHAPR
jgi:hypothetical protein